MTFLGAISIACLISFFGLGYIYVGYPVVVGLLSRFSHRPIRKGTTALPVSVVIVAHNEAHRIRQRIENLLSSDSADSIVEILIGSDGSTDGMCDVVRDLQNPKVLVHEFAQRRGKPSVLNDLIPRCRADIVVLGDARQTFAPQTLQELSSNFADPDVRVVSGELVLKTDNLTTSAGEGIGFYWKYEKFIRRSESQFRGVPGATGACYAIRKAYFAPIPAETILDDVLIPLTAVATGGRCLFEPRALAFDLPSQSPQQESVRKRRTIAGNAQLVCLRPAWMLPGVHPLWFELMSHKLARLVSPLLLVTLLVTNVLLLDQTGMWSLLGLQLAFYIAAAFGAWKQWRGHRSKLLGAALMFCILNWTTGLALWDAFRGRYRVTWQKTA